MYVLSKNKKNIKIFQLKIFIFLQLLFILHGHVFVMREIVRVRFLSHLGNKEVLKKKLDTHFFISLQTTIKSVSRDTRTE